MKIDYSEIAIPVGAPQGEDWEPPVHKFFGKKLPNGKTEKEPVYVHQIYPAMRYGMKDGRIVARIANNERENQALLAEGFTDTPATFGYIGAPSFDEHLAIKDKADKEARDKSAQDAESVLERVVTEVASVKRGPGRPRGS